MTPAAATLVSHHPLWSGPHTAAAVFKLWWRHQPVRLLDVPGPAHMNHKLQQRQTTAWAHLSGDVASCSSRGPTALADGARMGDRKGMASVAGLLLYDIRMLPSRCSAHRQVSTLAFPSKTVACRGTTVSGNTETIPAHECYRLKAVLQA